MLASLLLSRPWMLFEKENDEGGQVDNPKSGGQQDPPETPPAEDKKTFSQTELDGLFAERGKRAADAAINALLSDLGVENVEALKAAKKAAEDAENAKLSELEKAQKQTEKAQAERDAAIAQAEKAQAQATERLLEAAVITAAQEFNDPNDAWLYVDRSKIETGDDGQFKGVEDAVKVVAEAKPYLLKSENQTKSGGPSTPRQPLKRQPQRQRANGVGEAADEPRIIRF